MWKIFDNKQMWNFYDCTWRTSSREICLGQVSSEYFGESYLIIKVSENLDKISFCFLAEYGEYDFIHDDVECVSAVCATDSFTKYHMKFKNNKVAVIKCTNESSMHSFDCYFGDLFFKDEIETQCSMCGAKAEGYMNFCCHCGAEIHKTTKGYCTKCGQELTFVCPKCYTVLQENDGRYCIRCSDEKKDNKDKVVKAGGIAAGIVAVAGAALPIIKVFIKKE